MKIECGEKELRLIQQALELYTRVGLLQFDYLTLNNSLQKLIWDTKKGEEFRQKANELKQVFGIPVNSSFGIFNTEVVKDECRITCDMYQTIRHEFWKKDEKKEEYKYTVSSHPADICKIARIELPNFKVEL